MYIYFQKFSAKHRAISTTGGWCANTSKEDGGEHMTDQRLIPALADLFTGKVVQQVRIQRGGGGQGVRTTPGKSQVIWVSIGNRQLDPLEMLDPIRNLKK